MAIPGHEKSSLSPTSFAGTYEDGGGIENVTWLVAPDATGLSPGFRLSTTIRRVSFEGPSFDLLKPIDIALAVSGGFATGELASCVLTGELPSLVERDGLRTPCAMHFRLELPSTRDLETPPRLTLSVRIGETTYDADDEWFEDAVLALARRLLPQTRLISCATCLWSDYSPGGHGLLGMSCHRGARDQYLAVRSKNDYWRVPVTEEVMETHHCEQFAPRVPGTGYRG